MTDAADVLHPGPPSLIDFLGGAGPARVTDEELARDSPCLVAELQRGGSIVFSQGAVGPLDEEQQRLYCETGRETLQLTPEQEQRLQDLADSSTTCDAQVRDLEAGERLDPYLACMDAEMRRRESAAPA